MTYISRNCSRSGEGFGAGAEVLTNPAVYIKALGVLGVSLMFYYGALSMSKLDQKVLANSQIMPDVPAHTIEVKQSADTSALDNLGKALAQKEVIEQPREIVVEQARPAKGSIENIVETFKPRQKVGEKAMENTEIAKPTIESPITEKVEAKPESTITLETKPQEAVPESSVQPERPVETTKPVEKPQEVGYIPSDAAEAEAKAYIYRRESGNRLDAVNPFGCIGLGQDCNSALHIACPDWRTDRKCQDEFWERYMKRRYGSWTAAKNHWDARVPINGVDKGHWW